jgi:hypothetical protein
MHNSNIKAVTHYFIIFENNNPMTITDNILVPPPNITGTEGNSDSFLVCSIIFKNNDYSVEGRKFSQDSICWDVKELGFVITSNESHIGFSLIELNSPEMCQTFTMWHKTGINLLT